MQRNQIAILIGAVTVLALALVGTMAFGTVGADTTQESPENSTISVSGVGEATAAPDQGVVHVGVTAEGDDSDAVRTQLATDADALRSALDELGVAYETTDYDIDQGRHHREKPESLVHGEHTFEVTTDDPDAVGEIIDATAGVDAEIESVQLTLSDDARADLRGSAIDDAMADARTQADRIAGSGGMQVTGVSQVDASQRGYVPVEYDAGDGAAAEEDVNTVVESDDVAVTYNVEVSYAATDA